jgi:hypothetical protein
MYDYNLPEIRLQHESEPSFEEKGVFNEKRRSRFNQSLQNKFVEEPLLPEKEFLSNEPKTTRNSQRPNMLNTQRPNILIALPKKDYGVASVQHEVLDVLLG